jgi:predicted DNA-binding transcriptional regulator AlpA
MTNTSDDASPLSKRKSKKPDTPKITIDTIEDGLDRVALAMDKAGLQGAAYLPIYERLEAELEILKAKDDRRERARIRAARVMQEHLIKVPVLASMTDPPPRPDIQPRLLSKKDAAAYLGVSTPTFAKWVAEGLFPPSVSITKMWDKKAIDAQLDKLSGLEANDTDDGGYERRRLEREAKKAARSR